MAERALSAAQSLPSADEAARLATRLGLRPHRGHVALVLNFRGASDTIECISSLLDAGTPADAILVVDNASGGADVERIAQAHPRVPLLALPVNTGYAGGNNAAARVARAAGARVAVVLNNDTTVAPGFLDAIADFMSARPRVMVASPKITWYQDPERLWYAGGSYSPWRGFALTEGRSERDDGRFDAIRPVTFATGCAVAIRLEAVDRTDPFVGEFFGYAEDLELCRYAASRRAEVMYAPVTVVRHKEGLSFNALGGQPLRIRLSVRNTLWVARRYLRWYHWLAAGPSILFRYLGRFAGIYVVRRDAASLAAMLRGAVEGLTMRLPAPLEGDAQAPESSDAAPDT